MFKLRNKLKMNEKKHIINISLKETKANPKTKKTVILLSILGIMSIAYVNKDYITSLVGLVPTSFEAPKNEGFTLDLKDPENKPNSVSAVEEKNVPKEDTEIKKELINRMAEEIQKKDNIEDNENQFAVNFDNPPQEKTIERNPETPIKDTSGNTSSNLQKNIEAIRILEQQKEKEVEKTNSQSSENLSENTLTDANAKRELSLLLKNSKVQIDAKKESISLFINNIPHKIGDSILSNNNFYIKNISIDCKTSKLPSFNIDIYKKTDNVKLQTISKDFSENKKVVLFFDALSITDEESGNENVYLQNDEIFKGFKLLRIGYTDEKKVKQVFECNKTKTTIVGDELEIVR